MRAIKNLFVFVAIVAVLAGVAVGAFRVARQRPSAPEEIKPGLMAVSSAGAYLYAARAGTHVLLFDTGPDPAGHGVDVAVEALKASRGDVSDVFLTHGHGDHDAATNGLPGARVHLGEGDVPFAEGRAPWANPLVRVMAKAMGTPSINVSDPLTGAATIDVGGGKSVKAIPVPGHTPGSYMFLYDGVLFSGDSIILKQGRLDRGPGLFDSDRGRETASLATLKKQLGGAEIAAVCTGHGGCTPLGLGGSLLDDFLGRAGS